MDDLAVLRALLHRDDGSDRAFVDAMIRFEWSRTRDPDLLQLHEEVRAASLRSHEAIRSKIASGAFRGVTLREHFDSIPVFERDHFVEEVLGVAYPPLDEPELEPELFAYAPSGYDEIVHALDRTELGPNGRFLDIGSGTGKAVLLAALLTGAASSGIECNRWLDELARNASRSLGLDENEAHFVHGDARDLDVDVVDAADVVFMYLPFTGKPLATVMDRMLNPARRHPRFLCVGALDLHRYRDLMAAGPPKSWLHIYAWR